MKQLAIILGFLLLPIFAFGQIQLDDVAYKAYQVDVFHGQELEDGSFYSTLKQTCTTTNALFYFNDGIIFTTELKGQIRAFQFTDEPQYANPLVKGQTYPGYLIQGYDYGHFKCHISIQYKAETDMYILVYEYDNMRFAFFCKKSDERPWDNDPIDYVEEGKKYRTNPDYTEEEMIEFFNNFGNGEIILKSIVNNFYIETMGNMSPIEQ